MAVTRRVRKYAGASARNHDSAERMTEMMNGTHNSSEYNSGWAMNPHERIVSTQYVDGDWWVFTEELVMGPVR